MAPCCSLARALMVALVLGAVARASAGAAQETDHGGILEEDDEDDPAAGIIEDDDEDEDDPETGIIEEDDDDNEDNTPAEHSDLPAVVPEGEDEAIWLEGIKQSDAVNAAALLHARIIQRLYKEGKMDTMPYEIDMRPPPEITHQAQVHAGHEVPVNIYKTEADAEAEKSEDYLFLVAVLDVNECSDTDLPSEWKAECDGQFTECENTSGSYRCKCYPGTVGEMPCEGSVASDDCTYSCKNDFRDWETKCHREFSCKDTDECLDPKANDCNDMGLCDNVPCDAKATDCTNTFTCTCLEGYKGNGHDGGDGFPEKEGLAGCTDIDECAIRTHNCDPEPKAECTNHTPTEDNGFLRFACACKDGYEGKGTKGTCSPRALCKAVDAEGLCDRRATCQECSEADKADEAVVCSASPTGVGDVGQFKCTCDEHFEGDGLSGDGHSGCTAIDYCTNEKYTNDCNEYGTCVDDGEGLYHCECIGGFQPCPESKEQCADKTYRGAKNSGAHGDKGCVNVNECLSFKKSDCHFGAECIDLVPTKAKDFGDRFDCKCKESEGWHDNPVAKKPGFGAVGCIDKTPPKAFLQCTDVRELGRVDITQPVEVLAQHGGGQSFAKCTPEYAAEQQTEPQKCRCANGRDVYKQYSKYKELGMTVKDDSQDNHKLKQISAYSKLPATHGGYLTKVGKFEDAIRYTLQPASVQGVKGDKQDWYREIEVERVDECTDETIPEQFQHKCDEKADCVNTDESYECKCFEGEYLEAEKEEDGFGFKAQYEDYPLAFADGLSREVPGCHDTLPPVLKLTGTYPVEIQECLCGANASTSEMPEMSTLESHGLKATAYDLVWQRAEDGTWERVEVPVQVTQSDTSTEVRCADIPQSGEGLPPGVDFQPFSCDDVSAAWKLEYYAKDKAGNEAKPLSHYVIVRQIKVLERLKALEAFVNETKAGLEDSTAQLKQDHTATGRELETFSSKVRLWLDRMVLSAIAVVVAFMLWHGMLPTVWKMLNALRVAWCGGTIARHDFDVGYDLWLHLRSFGWLDQLGRAQYTAEAWAALEDAQAARGR